MGYEPFNEEQNLLRQSVKKFMEKEVSPFIDEWEDEGEFPCSLFKKMGELGFLGIPYPEKYGGSEGDFLSVVVFVEELTRLSSASIASSIMVHSLMAIPPILSLGSEELRQKYLVPAIKGEKVGALGITEPDAGSDVGAIRSTAVRDGDNYVINGTKTFITNGSFADFVTMAVKTDPTKGIKGISIMLVDTETPGFSVGRKLEKMGQHASGTAELVMEDVIVPCSNLLGEEGRGIYGILKNFEEERLVVSIRNVAIAQVALDLAVEYAGERKAFKKRLAEFQVIRHKLAEMATYVEAIRQFVYSTAIMFDRGTVARKEIAMCKWLSAEMVNRVAYDALQIHGGYGYMKEYPIERIYRDARSANIAAGTTEIMKEIISREMLGI